jgi:hypothetical protein
MNLFSWKSACTRGSSRCGEFGCTHGFEAGSDCRKHRAFVLRRQRRHKKSLPDCAQSTCGRKEESSCVARKEETTLTSLGMSKNDGSKLVLGALTLVNYKDIRENNVHPCVAGHPVCRDTFASGPSASDQCDHERLSSTHFILDVLFFKYISFRMRRARCWTFCPLFC